MTNEQKIQVNKAVEALEFSYDVLYDIEYNGEDAETVVEFNIDEFTFLLKAKYNHGRDYTKFSLSKHPDYLKYIGQMGEKNIPTSEKPEYIFDGKTVTDRVNYGNFKLLAIKLLINLDNEKEVEHLSSKLEEFIEREVHAVEEYMFDEIAGV